MKSTIVGNGVMLSRGAAAAKISELHRAVAEREKRGSFAEGKLKKGKTHGFTGRKGKKLSWKARRSSDAREYPRE